MSRLLRLSAVLVCGAFLAGHVNAQEAPVDWTGFYAGFNIGVGADKHRVADDNPNTFYQADGTGFLVGGTVGADIQMESLVLGVLADVNFANIGVSNMHEPIFGFYIESAVTALGSVRGRAGVAFDNALIYGTGGVAFGRTHDQNFWDPNTPWGSPVDQFRFGWVAGAGAEMMLSDRLSVRAEYLHYQFTDTTVTNDEVPLFWGIGDDHFSTSADTVTVGFNFHFN